MARKIVLAETSKSDLQDIHQIEHAKDTHEFIVGNSAKEHETMLTTAGVKYLNIVEGEQVIGYFILVIEGASRNVEFRRIAIKKNARGIGQQAINQMEKYCRSEFRCERIWLDVMAKNLRARHIYKKLGYREFSCDSADSGELLYYEKRFFCV